MSETSNDGLIQNWILHPYQKFGPLELNNKKRQDLIARLGEPLKSSPVDGGSFIIFPFHKTWLQAWITDQEDFNAIITPYSHFSIQTQTALLRLPENIADVRGWLEDHDPMAHFQKLGQYNQLLCPLLGLLWNESAGTICVYADSQKVHLLLAKNYESSSLDLLTEPEFTEKLHQIRKDFPFLMNTSWSPIFIKKKEPALPHCQWGGLPLIEAGGLPACQICGSFLPLIVQLDLAYLPAPLLKDLGQRGVLQIFHCKEKNCIHTFARPNDENKIAYLCRILPVQKLKKLTKKPKEYHPLKARYVVDWFLELDGPDSAVLFSHLKDKNHALINDEEFLEMYEDYLPFFSDKLGGSPSWQQEEDIPICPHCKPGEKQMQFVLQYKTDYEKDFFVGDGSSIYVFLCRKHPEEIIPVIQ